MKMIKLPEKGNSVYINADQIECVRQDSEGDCLIYMCVADCNEQNFHVIENMTSDEFVKKYLSDD